MLEVLTDMNQASFLVRRAKLLDALPDHSLLVLFAGEASTASRDTTLPYWVNRNFYYLTGLEREQMILVLGKRDGKIITRLWIERPDPDREKWTGYKMSKEAVTAQSGVEEVSYVEDFSQAFATLASDCETLWADLDRLDWEAQDNLAQRFVKQAKDRLPFLQVKNASPLLTAQRLIKTVEEVAAIRRGIDITWAGIKRMMQHAQPGMREYQLEAEFQYALMQEGVRQTGYPSIVASGKNAVVLHYDTNAEVAKDGDLVLLDVGAQWQHYSADISYTFPVSGVFTDRQRQVYELVWNCLNATTAMVRPGVTWQELNVCARGILAAGLKELGLIQEDTELDRYYYHSVGHFLGLDVHDVGGREAVFAPGMVVTIEPGLYILEEGIGIRLEDDVLVTETGFAVLSEAIVRAPDEIERIMRG